LHTWQDTSAAFSPHSAQTSVPEASPDLLLLLLLLLCDLVVTSSITASFLPSSSTPRFPMRVNLRQQGHFTDFRATSLGMDDADNVCAGDGSDEEEGAIACLELVGVSGAFASSLTHMRHIVWAH